MWLPGHLVPASWALWDIPFSQTTPAVSVFWVVSACILAHSVVPVQVQEELLLLSLLAVLLLLPFCSFLSLFVNPRRTPEDICRDVAALGTGPEPCALRPALHRSHQPKDAGSQQAEGGRELQPWGQEDRHRGCPCIVSDAHP